MAKKIIVGVALFFLATVVCTLIAAHIGRSVVPIHGGMTGLIIGWLLCSEAEFWKD